MKTDADLLAAWREGDRDAGEELFARHYPGVARFFANKTSGDPADLIQETFVSCVKATERIDDPERFRSFLFGIAYNVLRRHWRDLRVDGERLDFATHSTADLAPGPATLVTETEEERVLLAALRRIPLQCQVVIELFYWEDMTSAAIAEALGEPHGTIRTRLRRARGLLETEIERVAGDPALRRRSVSELDVWARRLRESGLGAAAPAKTGG